MLSLLAPLASLLGNEVNSLRERLQRRAIVYGVMGVFLLFFVVFLLVAANSGLSLWVGPIVAPLIIAGTALAIAFIALLVGYMQEAAARRREAEEQQRAQTAALLTSVATTAVPLLFRSAFIRRVGVPAGGALLAAYLLSRGSRDRSGPGR